jgi:hypothetical protein
VGKGVSIGMDFSVHHFDSLAHQEIGRKACRANIVSSDVIAQCTLAGGHIPVSQHRAQCIRDNSDEFNPIVHVGGFKNAMAED